MYPHTYLRLVNVTVILFCEIDCLHIYFVLIQSRWVDIDTDINKHLAGTEPSWKFTEHSHRIVPRRASAHYFNCRNATRGLYRMRLLFLIFILRLTISLCYC